MTNRRVATKNYVRGGLIRERTAGVLVQLAKDHYSNSQSETIRQAIKTTHLAIKLGAVKVAGADPV